MFIDKYKDLISKYLRKNIIINDIYLMDITNPSDVPDFNILHRDKEIEELIRYLSPLLKNKTPRNIFIFGKPGLGKTLIARLVSNLIEEEFKSRFPRTLFKTYYINFRLNNVITSSVRLFTFILRKEGIDVPITGVPLDFLYEKVYDFMEKNNFRGIFILDDLDELILKKKGEDILKNLLTLQEDLKKSKFSIICITNNLRITEKLDAKILNKFTSEIRFHPYTLEQLYDILKDRSKKALNPKSYDDNILLKIASIAYRDEGNARRAISILREAAELAESEGSSKITIRHIEYASVVSEERRILETVDKLPFHSQLLYKSILLLTEDNEFTTTGQVYLKYKKVCEILGVKPLTQRRISDLINELEIMGLITTDIISRGRQGRTREIRVDLDKSIIEKLNKLLNKNIGLDKL